MAKSTNKHWLDGIHTKDGLESYISTQRVGVQSNTLTHIGCLVRGQVSHVHFYQLCCHHTNISSSQSILENLAAYLSGHLCWRHGLVNVCTLGTKTFLQFNFPAAILALV